MRKKKLAKLSFLEDSRSRSMTQSDASFVRDQQMFATYKLLYIFSSFLLLYRATRMYPRNCKEERSMRSIRKPVA